MNEFKKRTCKDYTAWDLNVSCICYRNKNRRNIENMFRRKARRAINAEARMIRKEMAYA